MLYIHNITLLTPEKTIADGAVVIENGRFTHIGTVLTDLPENATILDGNGRFLVPGFIDLQLNGAFGHDFTTNPETIWEVAAKLPRWGVTSFLPTIITSPRSQIEKAQGVMQNGRSANFQGAEPLGLHLEGPFLNPQKKGAHNPAYIRQPDLSWIADWSPETAVSLVTLAPEQPNALAMVEELASRGVVVSAGHSMATFVEAQAGFANGVRYGTHLYNAMPPFGHREPGLIGALLNTDEIVAGIIPDGIHAHPAMVKLAWDMKGPHGLNVVTDAMAALGMPPGTYPLNDFEVTVTETEARLSDGTLAGSVLDMETAVSNLIRFTNCTLSEALATVTTTPARLLNLPDRGHIAPGFIADAVLLDADLKVDITICAGQIMYQRNKIKD
ncbi:MAG: N-acetylglucosamine-6-phosphate deacetylase [Anaerolineae bacterium]|nr:N-acetylglucosamine-6-phosphate deacetylase [Anaerolineae bacterium]